MYEPSKAQRQYLLHKKREKQFIAVSRILLFLLFLALWEVSARLNWIDSFIFGSPSLIAGTFIQMCMDQSLFSHIGITLAETLISFFLVVLFGIGTAVLLWACPKLAQILEPYLVVLNSLPKSALAPLLIVWLGANMKTIVVAGMSVAIFGSIINLYTGFCEIDPEKRKLIATLGGGKKDELFKIVLPSSVPLILSNMKVNIGLCLVGVIIGEFIGARKGLGYLIIYGSQTFPYMYILKGSASSLILPFYRKVYLHLLPILGDIQTSLMGFHNLLYDPKPHNVNSLRRFFFPKDRLPHRQRDTLSCICHRNKDVLPFLPAFYSNPAPLWIMADGILYQVSQGPFQKLHVS